MKQLTWLAWAVLITVLAACAFSGEDGAAFVEVTQTSSQAPAGEAVFGAETGEVAFDSSVARASLRQEQPLERLIIRTGDMDIVVEDTEESLVEIDRLVTRMEGWVVNSNVFQRNEAKSGSITVRVPVERYDELVALIRDLALEVRSESTNSDDVTEEFVDATARLENLEATADRVRAFLDEARNVEEALEVNRELSRLEGDIEALKGRLQYLSQSAAFSLLTINVTPDVLSGPIEVAGWRPEGVARTAIEALITALQGIGTIAIWGVTFCLPLGLILGLPAFFVFRFVRRRWRGRGSQAQVSDDQEST